MSAQSNLILAELERMSDKVNNSYLEIGADFTFFLHKHDNGFDFAGLTYGCTQKENKSKGEF